MWHPSKEGRPAKQKGKEKDIQEKGLNRSVCSEGLMQLYETRGMGVERDQLGREILGALWGFGKRGRSL